MKALRRLVALSLAGLAASAATGAAGPAASPSVGAPLPVQLVTATASRTAFVADAPSGLACASIVLWAPQARRQTRFASREQCREQASTGQGVAALSVASTRLLWTTFAGGNTREWSLWTATRTRRTARRLRFVARDVDAPPPVVLGPGTNYGLPYAVDREIVFLADSGKALFRTTVSAPVLALTTHPLTRPRRPAAVVALLASNELVGLEETGTEVFRRTVPAGVSAIAYDDRRSVLYQLGDVVHFSGGSAPLPAGAVMVDAARGQILWTRAGDLGVTSTVTRASRRVVDGSRARPVAGSLELAGLAWARGRVVHWRPGGA